MDAEPNTAAILAAILTVRSGELRQSLQGMTNPYGDGLASQKIVEVLTTVPLTQRLLRTHHEALPWQAARTISAAG